MLLLSETWTFPKQLFSKNEIQLTTKFKKIWNQLKTKIFCFQKSPRITWKIEVLVSHVNLSIFELENAPVTANNYLLKAISRSIRKRCEIYSKLTIKTPERRHWRRSGVFIVNFEYISNLFLVFLLINLNR